MINVVHYRNPLSPTDRVTFIADPGETIRSLTIDLNGGQSEWPTPTIALVNGQTVMRAQWDDALADDVVVEFRAVLAGGNPGGLRNLALNVATMGAYQMFQAGRAAVQGDFLGALGYATDFFGIGSFLAGFIKTPDVPAYMSGGSGSPTYSINYKTNRKRVGESIPVVYGTHRLLPDLISQPYTYFTNNDQYAAMVLCLGIGEFTIDTDSLKFGEALFSELSGITYQIVPPGSALSLANLSDHVSVSAAINGQTLIGPVAGSTIMAQSPSFNIGTYDNGDGTTSMMIYAPGGYFSAYTCNIGDSITITGTDFADGTYIVLTGSIPWVVLNSASIGDYSNVFGMIIRNGTPCWAFPPPIEFTNLGGGTSRIKCLQSGNTMFSAVTAGMTLAITGTLNDGYYSVASVDTVSAQQSVVVNGTTATYTDYYGVGISTSISGYIGWFECATYGQAVISIEADFICPRGVGTLNGSGGTDSRTITVELNYQGVTADGTPTGSILTTSYSITAATPTAQRRSFRFANDTGYPRVRIRGRRTTVESTSTSALDTVTWSGLKSFLPSVSTYPGVTVIGIVAKASEQLTAQQSGQVSVVATRKLPKWNGSSWSAVTPTNSPAWAIADTLRNSSYGAGISDSEIDLQALLTLDSVWASRGDQFNGVFDQSLTLWEALQKISRAGRAQPVLSSGVLTIVRDGPQSTRTAMFTPSNILPNSLAIDYRMPQEGDSDGTSVAWIDPNTWQAAHVDMIDGGGTPINPQTVDLFGCTSLAQATREATYLDRVRKYVRKSIRFKTEMDGHLVSVGDRIAVSHDVPAWGQSAEVLAYDAPSGTLTLSEPLTWSGSDAILLRDPQGTPHGPYTAAVVSGHPEKVQITGLDFTPRTDLSLGDRTRVIFGPTARICYDVVVCTVTPGGDSTVEIQGTPYDTRIHAAGA